MRTIRETATSGLCQAQRQRAPAVIIGLDCLPGIQTARILAENGVPVIGIARDPNHPFSHTKTCHAIRFTTLGQDELMSMLEVISSQLDQKGVLYPCTDASVLLVSRNREVLQQHYHVALPEPDTLEMLMDKTSFFRFARAHGLPVPATFFLRTRAEAIAASKQIPFPCIMKPGFKTPNWERNAAGAKAYLLSSAREFLAAYDRCSSWAESIVAQEWVRGTDSDLYSCNCYFDEQSRPIVTFVARKLRQNPPILGVSASGEECRNDIVLKQTIELFTNVRLRGLGYLEMKWDSCSEKYRIIEPNIGRPTGRSAIAEAGGVPLIYSMYCDLAGLPLPAPREQRYQGAKWIYFKKDLASAWYYWQKGELTLGQWARSLRGNKRDAVFSWSDPMPFLLDWWTPLRDLLRRGWRQLRRGDVQPLVRDSQTRSPLP
jgi:predicted ATP-grasp superfamily ATP-dependent carboligase